MKTKASAVTFRAPANPKPWTPTPEIVEAMVRRIVEDFDPVQVILFGSLARDEATADSDVDLLVVFDEVNNKGMVLTAIRLALLDFDVAKDVAVAERRDIEPARMSVGSFLRPALREGVVAFGSDG